MVDKNGDVGQQKFDYGGGGSADWNSIMGHESHKFDYGGYQIEINLIIGGLGGEGVEGKCKNWVVKSDFIHPGLQFNLDKVR